MNIPDSYRAEFERERDKERSKRAVDSVAAANLAVAKVAKFESVIERYDRAFRSLQDSAKRHDENQKQLNDKINELTLENQSLKQRLDKASEVIQGMQANATN